MSPKIKTVLTSAPAWLAAVVAVLTVVSTVVVPLLPVAVGLKVAAVVASGIAAARTLTKVVSVLTPVPEDLAGLEPATALDKAVSFGNAAAVDDSFWAAGA